MANAVQVKDNAQSKRTNQKQFTLPKSTKRAKIVRRDEFERRTKFGVVNKTETDARLFLVNCGQSSNLLS